MATATLDPSTLSLLSKSFETLTIDAESGASKISSTIFPESKYTDAEKAEIDQWVITASHIADGSSDAAKSAERLSHLNRHLSTRTTVLGSKPSVADIALYQNLAPVVSKWSAEERTGEQGYHHIVRHVDFVQNASVFDLKLSDSDKVKIDSDDIKFVLKPIDAKAEKARLKKEKEAAAAASVAAGGATATNATPAEAVEQAGGKKSKKEKAKDKLETVAAAVGVETPVAKEGGKKKEKKEKAPKPQKPAPVEKPLSPSLIDLRVGHILKCVQHPDAEKLFVSTMAVGDAPGTDNTSEYEGQTVRTVCSGLNGLIPLEEMQNRKIVAVCNLKPVTMRGVKSSAMVLAASPRDDDSHAGPVELVSPPTEAKAGERVYFEGWEGDPEAVLNPKKKIWETIQPGFTTTDDLTAAFKVDDVEPLKAQGKTGVGKLRTKEGFCTVKTLRGATIR
jgi:aminoacyl tRNA synthase complex-interacting multifunctional protein 1